MITKHPKETFQIGEKIGSSAKKGAIYALVGDLGAGKTVFSQGFARGLGISTPITSPSYAIVHEYPLLGYNFQHMDAYRINALEELEDIGFEDFLERDILLIEWGDRIKDVLPPETIWIYIDILPDYQRKITIKEGVL